MRNCFGNGSRVPGAPPPPGAGRVSPRLMMGKFLITAILLTILAWMGELSWARPAYPELPIDQALKLAEQYLQEKHLDNSGRYIHAIHLEYDDGSRQYPDGSRRKGFYWYVHWAWAAPRLGGELSLRIFMDKTIILEKHGP